MPGNRTTGRNTSPACTILLCLPYGAFLFPERRKNPVEPGPEEKRRQKAWSHIAGVTPRRIGRYRDCTSQNAEGILEKGICKARDGRIARSTGSDDCSWEILFRPVGPRRRFIGALLPFQSCTAGVITTRRRGGLPKPDQGFTPVSALERGH